jgi:protein-S-isoprenylcysteine O-methyltransferase Ste14
MRRDKIPSMPTKSVLSPLQVVMTALYLLGCPALLFLLAGDWRWREGWIFAGWFIGLCMIVMVWLYRNDPELLVERYRRPGSGGQSGWDRALVYGLLLGFIAWLVMMPLDARRFRWTPSLSPWPKGIGAALLMASAFLLFRAYRDNRFLSPLVRIQSERKHRVVSTGVYGFLRHPMYLGGILMFVGTPLLLGSVVGLAIAVVLAIVLAARIVGEERLLVNELEGYAEYQRKVCYRLFPFVW